MKNSKGLEEIDLQLPFTFPLEALIPRMASSSLPFPKFRAQCDEQNRVYWYPGSVCLNSGLAATPFRFWRPFALSKFALGKEVTIWGEHWIGPAVMFNHLKLVCTPLTRGG